MIIHPFILKYLPQILLVVGVLGIGAWAAYVWADRADAKREVAELGVQIETLREALRASARLQTISEEVSLGYFAELERIRNRPPVTRVVRLCPSDEGVSVPGTPGNTNGTDAPGGELPGGSRPDIGPRLYYEAGRADAIVAQCRALQNWLKEVRDDGRQ